MSLDTLKSRGNPSAGAPLDASGFLDDHGQTHTRAKIACTPGRLRPRHHPRLRELHVRLDVLALLARELEGDRDVALRRTA